MQATFLGGKKPPQTNKKTSVCVKREQCCIHTYSDGVDLSFYLQSAVVALKGIDHLFELGLTDHKALSTFMVLLLITLKSQQKLRSWKQAKNKPWYILNGSNVNSADFVTILPTYHFPLFAFQLQHWRQSAGRGSSGGWPGGCWERFGSCLHRACLRPQLRILMGLLGIRHMLQPWMCIKQTWEFKA